MVEEQRVRIPVQADHRFQAKPITDSTASRSAIPPSWSLTRGNAAQVAELC
jgi:hypothetical protein